MITALMIRIAVLAVAFAAIVILVMRPWFLGGRGGPKGNEATSGVEFGSNAGTSGDSAGLQ